MAEELPQLRGRKTPKEPVEPITEELSLQDVDIPRAPEVVISTPDVPSLTDTTMAKRSETQHASNKRLVSDKQKAALAKARQSKLEKKRLRQQGTDLGNAPDTQPQLLIDLQKKMDQKFEEFTRTLHDIRQVVPASKPKLPEDEQKVIRSQETAPPTVDSFSHPSKKIALNPPVVREERMSVEYNGPVYQNRDQSRYWKEKETLEMRMRAKSNSRQNLLFEDSPDARAANRISAGKSVKYITF
jgi:hypothetical protein